MVKASFLPPPHSLSEGRSKEGERREGQREMKCLKGRGLSKGEERRIEKRLPFSLLCEKQTFPGKRRKGGALLFLGCWRGFANYFGIKQQWKLREQHTQGGRNLLNMTGESWLVNLVPSFCFVFPRHLAAWLLSSPSSPGIKISSTLCSLSLSLLQGLLLRSKVKMHKLGELYTYSVSRGS